MKDIGDRFQEETKYYRHKMTGGGLNWSKQPELYKSYPGNKRIPLPDPLLSAADLDETIKKRRSIRDFSSQPINKEQLSYMLWASTGIQRKEHGYEFRTVPSAGALYPIETYIVVNKVEDLAEGIYHYNVKEHILEELREGDFGDDVAHAALGQQMCANAAVVFIWTAIFNRSKWKYGQRAYRYVYLDAGHIAENLALAATGQKLGCCPIAALFDDDVNKIIDVDGIEESTIYMTAVGNPQNMK